MHSLSKLRTNSTEKPHAQLLPDFIGRTEASPIELYVAARDCGDKDRPFISLVDKPMRFNIKPDGKKSKRRAVQNQKIATDHIYIRGKFNTISLIVYGYIDDKLTQSLKPDHKETEKQKDAAFDAMFDLNSYNQNNQALLDMLDEFELYGVNTVNEMNENKMITSNIPKKLSDADGLLFDPSLFYTYSNLKVLKTDYYTQPPNLEDNVNLFTSVCHKLLDLYPLISRLQSILAIQSKVSDKNMEKMKQFYNLRETTFGLFCGDVCSEIIKGMSKENLKTTHKYFIDIIEMCCQQIVARFDIAIYLDFLFNLFKRTDIQNGDLLLRHFVDRGGNKMNGELILYDLILDDTLNLYTRMSVIKLLSLMIEFDVGMKMFLRSSDVSNMKAFKNKMKTEKDGNNNNKMDVDKKEKSNDKEEKEEEEDTEMKDKTEETSKHLSGLQILVKLSTSTHEEDIIEAIKPIFQQV